LFVALAKRMNGFGVNFLEDGTSLFKLAYTENWHALIHLTGGHPFLIQRAVDAINS
jgi:hypothetical protein